MGLGILHWGLGGALKRYAFWMGVTGAHSLGRLDDWITATAVDLVPGPNVGSLAEWEERLERSKLDSSDQISSRQSWYWCCVAVFQLNFGSTLSQFPYRSFYIEIDVIAFIVHLTISPRGGVSCIVGTYIYLRCSRRLCKT